MARRTFFSFHYDNDISRANVVRHSWLTQDREAAGFFDASLWEESKKKGKAAIESMIAAGLKNTTVTAVLIGTETSGRDYVLYELKESLPTRQRPPRRLHPQHQELALHRSDGHIS